jgi:hypothetical protein
MIQIKVYTDNISFQYQFTNQDIVLPGQDSSTVLMIKRVSSLNNDNAILSDTIKAYSSNMPFDMFTFNNYILSSVIYQNLSDDANNPTLVQLYDFYHVPGDYVQYLYKTQQIPLFIPTGDAGNISVDPVFQPQQVLKTWQEIKSEFQDEGYPLLKIEVPNFNHYTAPIG